MKNEFPKNDREFTDFTIEKVEGNSTSGWTITFNNGWCFGVPQDSPVVPTVGMHVRQYGAKGLGGKVRGLFLNGEKVFYLTDKEQKEKDAVWLKQYKEEETRRKLDPKNPEPQIEGFEWTDEMREISGFGGGYEKVCRTMVSQGCKFWSEHPELTHL